MILEADKHFRACSLRGSFRVAPFRGGDSDLGVIRIEGGGGFRFRGSFAGVIQIEGVIQWGEYDCGDNSDLRSKQFREVIQIKGVIQI